MFQIRYIILIRVKIQVEKASFLFPQMSHKVKEALVKYDLYKKTDK